MAKGVTKKPRFQHNNIEFESDNSRETDPLKHNFELTHESQIQKEWELPLDSDPEECEEVPDEQDYQPT